ncbi:MAG: phage tail protein I [Alphaproteobacteria bacterium HGW-Alphaproteobacteria-13]|nr:MAG: phage tail protein I [Alphaproteobacteria bacterium HGW-Alphaproteobacteria-13]
MSDLPSILPPNSTALERAAEQAMARIGTFDVDLPRRLWNPWTCPPDMLPWLAWGLSMDSWDANWPIEVRRARVAAAISIQRRKGTAKSVFDVVESFGAALILREWWQMDPPGTPHTFAITVTLGGSFGALPAAYIEDIIAEVTRTKPVRSHFIFSQGIEAAGGIRLAAAARPVLLTRLAATAA